MKFILNSRSHTRKGSLIHYSTRDSVRDWLTETSNNRVGIQHILNLVVLHSQQEAQERTGRNPLEIVWGLRSGDSLGQIIDAKWRDFHEFWPFNKNVLSNQSTGTAWAVDDPLRLPNCSCDWHNIANTSVTSWNYLLRSIKQYFGGISMSMQVG